MSCSTATFRSSCAVRNIVLYRAKEIGRNQVAVLATRSWRAMESSLCRLQKLCFESVGRYAVVQKAVEKWQEDKTPVVAAVTAGTLAFVLWAGWGVGGRKQAGSRRKRSARGGRNGVALRKGPEDSIAAVEARYEKEFRERAERVVAAGRLADEKDEWECNFCKEMLLKLLIELDGIELTAESGERRATLKKRRKAAILKIQEQLKRLDELCAQ
ncbi:AGR239Wp [Eremothecium gossypii ATCC 10895]|uniref:AGR239Wp n=1 Tax=Eremothecium gossypii (strain ATCC 10895 / CBS 109.51 / FGSC 9923 / NRRL Y-1056) TaxID=284811 RepID=Q74ZG8_EREGS|nr:AGR239Wp [Eremothecium gossypii ATCC 10895]AAS54729.1 AGR239Wp [Eremothecium gossypii ATCC 10895]